MVPRLYEFKCSNRLATKWLDITKFYANSFFCRSSHLWNSLPTSFFPVKFDIAFKFLRSIVLIPRLFLLNSIFLFFRILSNTQ